MEVDQGTGEVEIVEWGGGHDCGNVINPLLVEGQVLGGIAHGLVNAMYEESVYSDEGQPQATSYLDYPSCRPREFRRSGCSTSRTPSRSTRSGSKGAGEAGTSRRPPRSPTAVEDALRPLGVRINACPLAPGRIGDLIAQAQEEPAR